MSVEIRNALGSQYNAAQEKNAYFLLAAAASAIGFAMTQTKIEPLSLNQIPLGIAVFLWAFSFYSGMQFIAYSISITGKNCDYLEMRNRPALDQNVVSAAFSETAKFHADKKRLWGNLQEKCLLFGALSYIAWHIIRMYLAGQ